MTVQQNGTLQKILAWWVDVVQRHAKTIIALVLVITGGILAYSINNFRINLDTANMISSKLHFRKVEMDYYKAFPNLTNTIVLVIEARTADSAMSTRDRLVDEIRKRSSLFKSFYVPGGGQFFEQNGLLYLSQSEVEDFADNMAAAQPFLALLSRDLSLPGLFSVFNTILDHPEEGALKDRRTLVLFNEMNKALESTAADKSYFMPWQELMLGEKETARQRKQFIILQPVLDFTSLSAGEEPLDTVRAIIRSLALPKDGPIVRLTGDTALDEENLNEVRNSVGIATVVSFILVALILYVGLWRSGRLIFSSLATLLVGLIWTTGFAIAFIGSLNMISITFAVLFIGLGIDYSIQFCLRFRELSVSGTGSRESDLVTAKGVGRGLLFSCITTAIGFYAFAPTAYAGVTDLGLIAGTGMFISFFMNLTLLPALLTVLPVKGQGKPFSFPIDGLIAMPYRYPKPIIIASLVLGILGAAFLPKVYFDYNPLNLYNPKSEALQTIQDLFKDSDVAPWTVSVLVKDEKETKALADKLSKLKEVNMAVSIFDFVPEKQGPKKAALADVRFFMPPLGHVALKTASCQKDGSALATLEEKVRKNIPNSTGESRAALDRLLSSLQRFKELQHDPEKSCKAFTALEQSMLSGLPDLFHKLDLALSPKTVTMSQLPQDLKSQYISVDGRYRIQVFPKENVLDREALVRFVNAVYGVTKDATDSPVTVYESGMAIISSFRTAVFLALAAIVVFILISMRSVLFTTLILIPLVLALLLTAAASVLLDIPLNFANVIVVPLLLGVGVHNGILFTLRYQTEPPSDGNMLKTSTARAIFFSSLTMITSTGSLAFSAHRGIASIGILLTLCFSFLIVSTLILMPAMFHVLRERLNRPEKTANALLKE